MVVIGVRDKDIDDAEPLRIQRPGPILRPTRKLGFNLHVDVRPREVIDYILNLLPSKKMA
jgi:hypothetical protein